MILKWQILAHIHIPYIIVIYQTLYSFSTTTASRTDIYLLSSIQWQNFLIRSVILNRIVIEFNNNEIFCWDALCCTVVAIAKPYNWTYVSFNCSKVLLVIWFFRSMILQQIRFKSHFKLNFLWFHIFFFVFNIENWIIEQQRLQNQLSEHAIKRFVKQYNIYYFLKKLNHEMAAQLLN